MRTMEAHRAAINNFENLIRHSQNGQAADIDALRARAIELNETFPGSTCDASFVYLYSYISKALLIDRSLFRDLFVLPLMPIYYLGISSGEQFFDYLKSDLEAKKDAERYPYSQEAKEFFMSELNGPLKEVYLREIDAMILGFERKSEFRKS